MKPLAPTDRALLTQPIVRHLLKAERGITYSQLAILFSPDESKTRLADKTLQKCRRRGWIAFKREDGFVLWRPTDAGRALSKLFGSDSDAQVLKEEPQGTTGIVTN